MRSYRYGSYHGQSKFRAVLKVVVVALAIVLVLLVAAFFYLQQYIVYSADGVRLELPFLQNQDSAPTPPLVVTTPSPTPIVVTPSPEPEAEPTYFYAAAVPGTLLANGRLKDLYTQKSPDLEPYIGASTLYPTTYPSAILTMKGADGKLQYVSDLQLAKTVKASASDPAMNENIRLATGENGVMPGTAAYVVCFRDNTAPYNDNKLALRTSIGNWRAPGDYRYMSPAVASARQYLSDICTELAGLQFSEIILDDAAYPIDGTLSSIVKGDRYDAATFESTVTGFYQQVKEAVNAVNPYGTGTPLGTRLSIVCDKSVLTNGSNPTSGQSLSALAQYADRIYVDLGGETPDAYWDKLSAAGFQNPREQLVSIVDAPLGESVAYSWAVLPK